MGDIYFDSPDVTAKTGGQDPVTKYTGNEDTDKYLSGLSPEDRQKALAEASQPLTGKEAAQALKQDPDLELTKEEYLSYLEYHKTEETHLLSGIAEGASSVMSDIVKGGGSFFDHPLEATAKLTPSLIEAFSQGTRNLYGMLAQSADPDSILFKMKDAIAGNGTDQGYQQFLEARKFLKHSGQLASGEQTLVMDKDVIDHNMTQAMSYIADPTLFIPFGEVASAGIRVAGMGEKLASLSMKAGAIKAAVIGGGLKWGIGAPIELMGGAVRGTIDRAAQIGGSVLETATGMSAADLKGTLKMTGVASSGAAIAGHGVPLVSDIGSLYVGATAAGGIGQAVSAIGEQMMNQGLKRGNLSFAAQALIDTERAGVKLSAHAKGLLKVIDTFDPLLVYGATAAEGAAHGAMIGGTLGYLSGGEEGMAHGIGAGMALGGTGAIGGKMFADVSGGTRIQRAEVQGQFNFIVDKENNPKRYQYFKLALEGADTPAKRAAVLQVYGGIDAICPKAEWFIGDASSYDATIRAKGYDPKTGQFIDPKTNKPAVDASGKPLPRTASTLEFHNADGFCITNKDGVVSIHINTDSTSSSTIHHELFHGILRTTMMKDGFLRDWSGALLGRFDVNGKRVEAGKVDPAEFKQFTDRYIDDIPKANGESDADYSKRKVDMKKQLSDAHDSFAKNSGDLTKMSDEHRNALLYHTEEFGAYYFEKFLEGKPLDYLFHGGVIPGVRGILGDVQQNFSDYWLRKSGKANPSFDFAQTDATGRLKPIESTFKPEGNGSRVRNPALDGMLNDLIKAHSANVRTNSVALGELTATGRLAYIKGQGLDGLHALFDPVSGAKRNLTQKQIEAENTEKGKAIHDALIKMPPADRTSVTDGDGNITGNFSDKELTHLVKEGHISQPLADRLKAVQDVIADPTKPNVFGFLYHGLSKETAVVGNSQPRLRGGDVPVTSRRVVPVGHTTVFGKDGTMSIVMHGLDMNVIDARGNNLWSDPKVRALWGDNRVDFDASFADYLNNASKAGNDPSRVLSELIPSLAQLDGNGGARRDVMHQFLGLAKAEGLRYQNKPIAEIPRGTTSSMTSFRMDLMTPFSIDNMHQRMNFDLKNAFEDLSTNFKVRAMDREEVPNGNIWTHASGYKIVKETSTGNVSAWDSNGERIGSFKDTKSAEDAAQKAYAKEQAKIPDDIKRGIKTQQDFQGNFKKTGVDTRRQAIERGDYFKTDEGEDFAKGTKIVRQTREEFYGEQFIKLRQSDPDTVLKVTEEVLARGDAIRTQRDAVKKQMDAEIAANVGKPNRNTLKLRELFDTLSLQDRTGDLKLAYERAKAGNSSRGAIGQSILDYINSSRKNGARYDEMAKVFFGEHYDSQFNTGEPVTTVATHGTSSSDLLITKEFNPERFGSKHGSDADAVGAFLAGEIKTSRGYADTKEGNKLIYRQVRAAIKFNNPFVVDANHTNYTGWKYQKYISDAKAGGHDGIIIKNVYDGGFSDTVFILMADKVKDNSVILDTVTEHGNGAEADKKFPHGESTYGAYAGNPQASMPRGAKTMTELGGSWKNRGENREIPTPQDALKEAAFRQVVPKKDIDAAKLAGRYEEDVPLQRLAGRSVGVVAYDSAGVAHLVDRETGRVMAGSRTQGGVMHSVISETLGHGHSAIASTGDGARSILKIVHSIQEKARLAGQDKFYVTILGSDPAKMTSSAGGVRLSNSHLTSLMAKGLVGEADVRASILEVAKMVDKDTGKLLYPNLGVSDPMSSAEMLKAVSGDFAHPNVSSFNQRKSFVRNTISKLINTDSWKANKEGIKQYFGTNESVSSIDGVINAIGLSGTDKANFGADGKLIPYGHIFAAIEFDTNKTISVGEGGHKSYPFDLKHSDGTPVKLLRFAEPMLASDAAGSKEGKDIGNKVTVQVTDKDKASPRYGKQAIDLETGLRKFTEMPSMNFEVPTAGGVGEMKMKEAHKMIHRDPNFNTGLDTAELGLKDLVPFKTRDNAYHSALNKTVEDIFTRTVGKDQMINPARLLNLIKSASGGNVGRILTEAKANGLIEMLEAGGQKKMPIAEIRKFLTDNEIKVTSNADTLRVDADFGNTQDYVSKPWNPSGNKSDNYHTLLLNIAPQYAHGVAGHFDKHSPTGTTGDTIAHARATVRRDAQGRSVLNVEEIQPQNSNAGVLSPAEKTKAVATYNKLKEITDSHTSEVIKERREAKGRVLANTYLFDALGTAHDADSIPYYLKRLENWFDTAREDIPDATPALMQEMMGVINKGMQRYNASLSRSEQVPVGAKSPAEMLSVYRNYNHSTDSWIPTYYLEAISMGVGDYASLVHKTGAVDSPYQKPLTANDVHQYPVLVETIKNKQALQKKISDSVKQELKAKFTKEEMPAAYKEELINPDFAKMKQSEIEYSIKKTANDKPLQDFAETTRLMHREIMAKAVELGVDRVTFVQSKDTHPDVQMRNERGAALYDRDIPAMVNGELKKFGTELKPANNIDKSPNYPSSDSHNEHTMLSENLGYDITPEMAKAVSKSQPTYKTANRTNGIDTKPFEGNFKVSKDVRLGVAKVAGIISKEVDKSNLSVGIKEGFKALQEAVRKQDATDEVLVPQVRTSFDALRERVRHEMANPDLTFTPASTLKEIKASLDKLDPHIKEDASAIAKRVHEADMAEGSDVEGQAHEQAQATHRRDMEEGASLESDQSTAEIDRRRGDARLDMEEGANLDSDQVHQQIGEYNADQNEAANVEAAQPRNQNLPPPFPYPAPPIPAGLPRPTPSGKPAFPRPPTTPPLPPVTPRAPAPAPQPPALPPRTLPPEPTIPTPVQRAWRGWSFDKSPNGGVYNNAVGWMIMVQGDKFKVYNPQKAMMGIYQDLDQAKRRVQREEPKR